MIGLYFSGTGNTKFCVNRFVKYYNDDGEICSYSIEDKVRKILICDIDN